MLKANLRVSRSGLNVLKNKYKSRFSTSTSNKISETFGEVKKDKQDKKKSILDEITTDKGYASFFDGYSMNSLGTANKDAFSIQEKDSFYKVFEHLEKIDFLGKRNKESNIKTKDGISFTNNNKDNISSLSSFGMDDLFAVNKTRLLLDGDIIESYKKDLTKTNKISKSLKPTLQHINTVIQDSESLSNFIQTEIIDKFLLNDPKDTFKNQNWEDQLEEIEKLTKKTPGSPPVNRVTLPVLLKFSLESLTYGFDSVTDTMDIVNSIKNNSNISLYVFGCNTDLYNSLLLQYWRKTKNLSLVYKLINEMQINGIVPNLLTYKITATIFLKVMSVKDGIQAYPYLLWSDSSDLYQLKDYIKTIHIAASKSSLFDSK